MSYEQAVNEILRSFGIEEYPEEMQEAFLLQFGGILFRALMLRGVEALPASSTDEFDELISSDPDPQDVFAFFEEHLDDFEGLLATVVTELKNKSEAITHEFLEEVKDEA